MTKQELKIQYDLKKISSKEYFLELGRIIKQEVAALPPVKKEEEKKEIDFLAIFDNTLPLFNNR